MIFFRNYYLNKTIIWSIFKLIKITFNVINIDVASCLLLVLLNINSIAIVNNIETHVYFKKFHNFRNYFI